MLSELINFLAIHFERNVDKSVKKAIAIIFKELFIDFSGLSHNQASLAHFNRKVLNEQQLVNNNKCIVDNCPEQY